MMSMLYKKSKSETLDKDLFLNPTSEYRAAPFWAWNCKLEKKELLRQIEKLKEMGFGGYHMHVRNGMATEYLSDEFMDLIDACVQKGKKEEMLSWLYDEDRWPSGFAGGIVTKNPEYRIKYLLVTVTPYGQGKKSVAQSGQQKQGRSENGKLLARFNVKIDKDGYLEDYKLLEDGEKAADREWFVYLESPMTTPRFNNQTYVDTLSPAAIAEFIRVTYERYKEVLGDDLGTAAPAIFTDEPQFMVKAIPTSPFATDDIVIPFTSDFEETYFNTYGDQFLPTLPEIFWDLPNKKASVARYRYHDHACQRFTEAFCDQCGKWCAENGIMLTGHMMEEPTLESQTRAVGEAMRSYRGFQLPGIDMLFSKREYNTAKQAQSAVHQYGREGMMSELYGVTNWDMDFREYKINGDWQAALGVTLRVPHLSLVSMEGEAKRDYPASINYQSPWYKEYKYLEDHFARVSTVLTRGKPLVRIGVIHPIESFWLAYGPRRTASIRSSQLDENFASLTNWMITGGLDFDFICEALLPELCNEGANPLKVGKMSYDTIIIPSCTTLRRTTFERLVKFARNGGKLVIAGEAPTLIDAAPSDDVAELLSLSEHIGFNKADLYTALDPQRYFTIYNDNYTLYRKLVSNLRKDGDSLWLFLAQANPVSNHLVVRTDKIITVFKGLYDVELFNTLDGSTSIPDYKHENGNTLIYAAVNMHDSLLYKLTPAKETVSECKSVASTKFAPLPRISCSQYALNEPNALLLDCAEYSLDGEEFAPSEYILHLDTALRKRLGWPVISGSFAQPWCVTPEKSDHEVTLRCTFESDIEYAGALLAIENPDKTKITFNGTSISNDAVGYYTDKAIKTVMLTPIVKGTNVLTVTLPFENRASIECMYVLGKFGVELNGADRRITALPEKLFFCDITKQKLAHYGGKLTYSFKVNSNSDTLKVSVPQFKAACLKVSVDGSAEKSLSLAPYCAIFEGLDPGEHTVELSAYISRQNAFGHIHHADKNAIYCSPPSFRTTGDLFTYEYKVWEEGIVSAPTVYEKV